MPATPRVQPAASRGQSSPPQAGAPAAVPAKPSGTSNLDYVRSALAARQATVSAAAQRGSAGLGPNPGLRPLRPVPNLGPMTKSRPLMTRLHWAELAIVAAIVIGFLGYQISG